MTKWKVVNEQPAQKQWRVVDNETMPEQAPQMQEAESFASKLPRNVASGLAQAGHSTINMPHDIIQALEQQGASILPKLLNLPNMGLPKIAEEQSLSQYIPHQQEYNFAQMLGQKGEGTASDKAIQTGFEYLPEALSVLGLTKSAAKHLPALSKRQILSDISKGKEEAVSKFEPLYNGIFNEAAARGVETVPRPAMNAAHLVEHGEDKFMEGLKRYLYEPTLQHAHEAQSDLGFQIRYLEEIRDNPSKSGGLTSTQQKTLREAKDARTKIQNEMFSKNRLGAHSDLDQQYKDITNKYREEVVPYKRLHNLTEYEKGRQLPRTTIKKLRADDQFMIELGKRYPGLKLYSPLANFAKGGLAAGIAGSLGLGGGSSLIKKLLG